MTKPTKPDEAVRRRQANVLTKKLGCKNEYCTTPITSHRTPTSKDIHDMYTLWIVLTPEDEVINNPDTVYVLLITADKKPFWKKFVADKEKK